MVVAARWQQAADWHPKLRSGVEFSHVSYRKRPWLLLQDPVTGAHYRLPVQAERLLQGLDGESSLDELVRDNATSNEDQLLELLLELERNGLLEGERSPWWQRVEPIRQGGGSRLQPLLFWRFRLLDPDPLLERLGWLASLLFQRWMLWPWMALQLVAWLTLAQHWDAWSLHWQVRFSDPLNLLSLWLLYPLLKLLHELGHGLAVKAFGGQVRHAGLMFLVFTPLPYVDASTSHAMSRNRRMAVAGAGILVELAVSAIALLLWVSLAPGMARDLAFDLVVIGGLSTLLFNGNPLLRYDGYYLLADALEIPNLASRSRAWLFNRLALLLAGTVADGALTAGRAEQRWLFWYGLASLCYRPLVALGIGLFLAQMLPGIGMLIAAWVLLVLVAWPLLRSLYRIFNLARAQGGLARFSLAGALLLSLVVATAVLPVASSTRVEGVLKLPEQAQIRAKADGFVRKLEVASGDPVDSGQLLLTLGNEELAVEERAARARLDELLARLGGQLLDDPAQHAIYQEQIRRAQARLARLQDEVAALQLLSPLRGRFQLSLPPRAEGRYVRRGELIGYLVPEKEITLIEAALQQDQLEQIDGKSLNILVRPEADAGMELPARLVGAAPKAADRLPDSALGSLGGGEIPVDVRDASGITPLQPVFLLRLETELPGGGQYLPHRFAIRMEHQGMPLAEYLYQGWRRLLARRLQI